MKSFVAAALLATSPVLAADLTGIPRIVDGDTIELAGTKIRLEGIDAPETDQLCLDVKGARWTCGIEAREQLQRRFGGKPWTCRISGQDRYGRSLGTCSAGGEDVDRWMVRAGWALAFVRYSSAYVPEERQARDARAGLWAGAFIAPWDWRGRNRSTTVLGAASVPANAQEVLLGSASAMKAPDPHCVVKATTSSGECIFHEPGGRHYARITITPGNGKRWFCSAEEARAAGCRAARDR